MKCPECGGTGVKVTCKNDTSHVKDCPVCKSTGQIQGYAKKAYSGKLTQLREKVKSLEQSRTDLIARATELQGKLNAYKNEVEQAVELADFYEKQAAENEKLAELLKTFIKVMIEAGIDVPNASQAPEILTNALGLLKSCRGYVDEAMESSEYREMEEELLENFDALFGPEESEIGMTIKQVSTDEETKDLGPQKGDETDDK